MFKSSRFVSFGRERRYPVLTALDLAIHFTLSFVVVAMALALLGTLALHFVPGLDERLLGLVEKLIR